MTFKLLRLFALASAFAAVGASAAVNLPALNIDKTQTTVSGLSSGGFMAVQLHVAYSATFKKGAGIVAGGPFYCAEGSVVNATGRCMASPAGIPTSTLVSTTNNWASQGLIDPVSNLQSSKVYMFSGTLDDVVKPGVMDALKKTNGETNTEKLITAMEGMTFDTPKGPMTFRKEDHQAMQSMYHFRVAPGARPGAMPDLHLVKEIKPNEMDVPIKVKR